MSDSWIRCYGLEKARRVEERKRVFSKKQIIPLKYSLSEIGAVYRYLYAVSILCLDFYSAG